MTSQAYNNNVLVFLLQIWMTGMLMFFWLCFLSPHFGREECCQTPSFGSSNTEVIRKITYMRNETKSISVRVTQFLVNSLSYTWIFLSKVNSFAYNLLAESAWPKHIICSSPNKLFHHNGMLYWSWLAFIVWFLLPQRTSLRR